MRFVLISRHTGREVPAEEAEQNLKEMGAWLALLGNCTALPLRGGRSVTANNVVSYAGDAGGVIIFEADALDDAIALAQKSPGLKYGFTHDVFPELSLQSASRQTK